MTESQEIVSTSAHSFDFEKIKLYAGNHAIEEAQFGISFSEPLSSSDYQRFKENNASISEAFPAITEMEAYQFNFGEQQPKVNLSSNGKSLADYGRDGQLKWTADFFENTVRVNCKSYSRWADVWQNTKSRLDLLLKSVDQKKFIISIDLMVTDTFSIDVPHQILPKDLFDQNSEYVCNRLLSITDGRWDSQIGWFEPHDETHDRLVRLDIRSVRRNRDFVVSLVNLFSLRPSDVPMRLENIIGEPTYLDDVFNGFHQKNKSTLQSVLNNRIATRMGL